MIIPATFNGPPDSANGGYTAGLLARYVASPSGAMVTLRQPPPLATPLDVHADGATIEVYDGDRLIASAAPAPEPLPPPVPAVSWTETMAVSQTYLGFTGHPFPTCFVCGPERPPGDGLRLFPGLLPDGRTASPWIVPEGVEPALMWAALDCPGGWAVPAMGLAGPAGAAGVNRPYVLGRMAARVDALPATGDGCVVMGACVGQEGRKAHVVSTVYGPDGAALAVARATWIALT
ncbi:hypothetical protein HC028_19650 [Planosporangium flavigriseum]|uniref:Thioesterase-like superfamily protein n=1 Tax=Planosporangium flavigriseum TaxID=373681 RepID=A0A8J3LNB9_9ACTN|nr:hypothetical protein [Planosporangium flavigriseum]NJC66705.1 hypothetical protein [Planosporangium flavigriseum]GIG74857.1 hypothetical protein Pfl04_32610 [Planosporangium flavigriseum]